MTSDAIQAAVEVSSILKRLGAKHLIGGSLASMTWGEPRFTQDVDLVVALEAGHVAGLLEQLGDRWYVDETSVREAIEQRSSFYVIRLTGMVKIDIFVPPDEGLHAAKWTRIRWAALAEDGGPELPITSPEDIVLQKLDWFRKGDEVSTQQWRDITSLLRIRAGRLDEDYLNAWARRLGLDTLLTRARKDALTEGR